MGANATIILNLILQGAQALAQYTALLANANSQGRDVTDAELDQLVTDYTAAKAKLDADIAAKGG